MDSRDDTKENTPLTVSSLNIDCNLTKDHSYDIKSQSSESMPAHPLDEDTHMPDKKTETIMGIGQPQSSAASMDHKQIEKLTWQIMHVEAEIMWIKVELAGINRDLALIESDRDLLVRPKEERMQQFLELAADFNTCAKDDPEYFAEMCKRLMSPEATRDFDWMEAIGIYIRSVEKFVIEASVHLELGPGESIADFGRKLRAPRNNQACIPSPGLGEGVGRDLQGLQDDQKKGLQDDQNKGLQDDQNKDTEGDLSTLDKHWKDLHRLIQEREKSKEHVKNQRALLRHITNQNIELKESINNQRTTMTLITDKICQSEAAFGVQGVFKRLWLLLTSLQGPYCQVCSADEAGDEIPGSRQILGPHNFFRGLYDHTQTLIEGVVMHQKKQYRERWDRAKDILGNPRIEEEPFASMKKVAVDSWTESVEEVIEKYQSDDGWMAVAGYETSSFSEETGQGD